MRKLIVDMTIVGVAIMVIMAVFAQNTIAIVPGQSTLSDNLSYADNDHKVPYANAAGDITLRNISVYKENYTFEMPSDFNFTPMPGPSQDSQKYASEPLNEYNNREDVIVYFKEMPASLQDFASAHGVKLIFSKPEIKMAAFETTQVMKPSRYSQIAERFLDSLSNDALVEKAEVDWFMFVNATNHYTGQPTLLTPQDMKRTGTDYAPNIVTVGFWKMPTSVDDFGVKYGGRLNKGGTEVNYDIKAATFVTDDVTGFINKVSKDPYVRYAEVCPITQIARYGPLDPAYYNGYQWYLNDTNTTDAWYYQTGNTNLKIAIVDTGVDYNHEDLSGRVISGWNFINNTNDAMDDNGHGTMCAGIAAAITNNNKGIAGISQSQILAVKAFDRNGSQLNPQIIANAITWAANNGAKIISMSFSSNSSVQSEQDACNYAFNNKGCLLVAASGNYGQLQNFIDFPAAYPNVLAIGGIDQNDQRCSFSNFGPQLFLVAPAVNITSTYPNNLYSFGGSGTSFAAPQVAGVAALVWCENPLFSNQQVTNYLKNSAVPLGSGTPNQEYGYGKLQGFGATAYGQIWAPLSSSLPEGYAVTYYTYIEDYTYMHSVLAANNPGQWILLEKWGSPPTLSSYDGISYNSGGMQDIALKGSGLLYITIYAYSLGGSYKLWTICGNPAQKTYNYGSLSGPGSLSYDWVSGVGNGYAFSTTSDTNIYTLYTKWNVPPTSVMYDAAGTTSSPEQFAGPVTVNGTLYNMIYSVQGSGQYGRIGAIY